MNDAEPPLVEIRSADGRHAALALTIGASPRARGTKPELVFNQYGSTEFLHPVREPGKTGAILEPSVSELHADREVRTPKAVGGAGGR